MKSVCIAVVATLAVTSVSAQELKEGWGFQFRQDTFDKTVLPLSMMSQEGDDFDKAMIAVACGPDGKLVSFFQPGAIISFDTSARVAFRDREATKEVTFTIGEVPHFGKRLMLDPEPTAALLTIFENANGEDVPFKTEKKQGSFGSIAAVKAFGLVRQHCPKQ